MSFYMANEHLYGLPERKNKYQINDTRHSDPYRMYSVDLFPHKEWDNTGLYSGIPYVTGHGMKGKPDSSLLWINAAETWVDVLDHDKMSGEGGKIINFISEGGVIEFFMIAASNPKRIHKRLATITGFPFLPPLYSLGFHYSRWE